MSRLALGAPWARWAIGTIALAAFGATTWFVGDLLVLGGWRPLEGTGGRLASILLVAAVWVGAETWRAHRSRRSNARMLEMLAAADGADSAARAAREVEVLRQRFEQAARLLRTARFRGPDGELRYVSELPWYVFVGAPGSGKTTALVNSGLRFPLRGTGGDPSLTGVGGTRNCDWWFTEDAVLLDTAGRYTTQESDREADAAAWAGFLGLLKRFRPQRPLNGVLVTLSVSDLLLWDEEQRARYAGHVRARLAELHERLGLGLPVYVMITKADLLAGFMEFFGELDVDARAQVWGATFGDTEASTAGVTDFSAEFAAVERRLGAAMIERLQQEPDLQRRAAIYRFPQELHGVGGLIAGFLEAAFARQPGNAALLRGVYFMSGTQEGSPIDRVLGSLARSFGLSPAASPALGGTGKSFFLAHLLQKVVFPESGLAGADPLLERRARRGRLAAYGAIASVLIGLGALWTSAYFASRSFVFLARSSTDAARRALDALGSAPAGSETLLLRALDKLRDLPGGYADAQQSEHRGSGWGLSQMPKLAPQAMRAYRNALADALLPRVGAALEDSMRRVLATPNSGDGLAPVLSAYVDLHEGRAADPKVLADAARRQWRLEAADAADLESHLRASLAAGPPQMRRPRDEAIIRDARRRIASVKGS